MRKVVVEIDENGNATVEGEGFVGTECTKLTAAIEEALGKVQRRALKPEYRQARTQGRTVQR